MTAEDQVASSGEFARFSLEAPVRYIVVDYRDVQRFEPVREDVSRVADRMRSVAAGTRIAIIAPHDLVYGMARMFELSTANERPWVVHVVRTPDEALDWLAEQLPGTDFSEARAALAEQD